MRIGGFTWAINTWMKGFVADMIAFPKNVILHTCTVYSKQLQKIAHDPHKPMGVFSAHVQMAIKPGQVSCLCNNVWFNQCFGEMKALQPLCCHNMQKWKSHPLNAFFFSVLQLKTFYWQWFMGLPNGSFTVMLSLLGSFQLRLMSRSYSNN